MLLETLEDEAAKYLVAQAAEVSVQGAKKLFELVKGKLGKVAGNPDELTKQLRIAIQNDPSFGDRLADELAGFCQDKIATAVEAPPYPFYDRDQVREKAPHSGVFVIGGRRGSGRTALALEIAQLRGDGFPVGVLRVDLTTFRQGAALSVTEVYLYLLRQIGLETFDLANGADEIERQFISATVTRRLILILRNARGVAEIKPFVTTPVNLVLVTTAELDDDIRGEYRHELLGPLDEPADWNMLAARCGKVSLAAEATAAKRLLQICESLPEALKWVGLALSRRADEAQPVADLVARLERTGLASAFGAIETSLRETLDALPADVRTAATLLAAHPMPGFTRTSASALLGRDAEAVVDKLDDAGLLIRTGPGRFRLHAPVHEYVIRAEVDLLPAFTRVLDFYRDCAVTADFEDSADRFRVYPPGARQPTFRPARHLVDFLDTERAVLLELVRRAHELGLHEQVCQLGGALEVLINKRGGHEWYLALNEYVIASAPADSRMLARAHATHGRICTLIRFFSRAKTHLDLAWALVVRLGDARLRASTLEFFGRYHQDQALENQSSDFRLALQCLREAVLLDIANHEGRGHGIHSRMLANIMIDAGLPLTEIITVLDQSPPAHGRNHARLLMVYARAYIKAGQLADAEASLAQARAVLHADGATQYEWELGEREAELLAAAGKKKAAKEKWGELTRSAFAINHPKAYRYLREL